MDPVITISMDEYKELLFMKAKYEELSNYVWFLQETLRESVRNRESNKE